MNDFESGTLILRNCSRSATHPKLRKSISWVACSITFQVSISLLKLLPLKLKESSSKSDHKQEIYTYPQILLEIYFLQLGMFMRLFLLVFFYGNNPHRCRNRLRFSQHDKLSCIIGLNFHDFLEALQWWIGKGGGGFQELLVIDFFIKLVGNLVQKLYEHV